MTEEQQNRDPGEMALLDSAAKGDQASLNLLIHTYTDRLTRLISLRIDRRLSARIDAEDILQEAFVEAVQHLPDYLSRPVVPFYLWLRGVTIHVLLEHHRRHFGTRKRDLRREIPLNRLEASSQALAACFADTGTSPSGAAQQKELRSRLEAIIEQLPAGDKEVLALRHFEQLSPSETAQVLQISNKAAGMRYLRALKRLREMLDKVRGGALDSE